MITEAQEKMIRKVSEFHDTKVWATYPGGSIRLCLHNKTRKEFEFLTITPNGASVGKDFSKEPADNMLMEIWKKLPKEKE